MSTISQDLPYNPFNPIKTYRLYSARRPDPEKRSSVKLTQQPSLLTQPNTNYSLFVRNQENRGLKSDKNFGAYIKKLEENCKLTKKVIQHTKQLMVQDQQQDEEHKKERRLSQFRTTSKNQKKEKFQHQITEMIVEIRSPNYRKGRYLLNDDKDKEKKLAKPLFCGIQNQAKQNQKKKQIFSHIDINQLRYKIFFDDYNPLQRQITSQQSVYKDEVQIETQQGEQVKQLFNEQ